MKKPFTLFNAEPKYKFHFIKSGVCISEGLYE